MHRFPDVPRILFKRFLLEAPVSGDLPAAVVQKVDIQKKRTDGGMCCDVLHLQLEQGEGNISAGSQTRNDMHATWLVTLIFMKETLLFGFDTSFSDVCFFSSWDS